MGLEDGHVRSARQARPNWGVCVHEIGAYRVTGAPGVEGTSVGRNSGESHTELRVASNDTAEATTVAVSSCEDTCIVDAEVVLHPGDQLLKEVSVSQVLSGGRGTRDAISRVRLVARRGSGTLNINSNAIRIKRPRVEPGLALNACCRIAVTMESKHNGRALVGVIVLRDVHQIGPLDVVRWRHGEFYSWSIDSEATGKRCATASSSLCDRGSISWVRRIADQSSLARDICVSIRGCEGRLAVALAASEDSSDAA